MVHRGIPSCVRITGYEVFLVGGAVRDALLSRTPKDFDIITSARSGQASRVPRCAAVLCQWHVVASPRRSCSNLALLPCRQIRKVFRPKYRCLVVGRRFPVCHVKVQAAVALLACTLFACMCVGENQLPAGHCQAYSSC
jgi:tRNA nucleotidyltransferase/poly(A) polymerase